MKIERRDSTKKTKKNRIHANTFHRSNNMTQFNSAVNGKEKKYGQKRQKDKTKDKRKKDKRQKEKKYGQKDKLESSKKPERFRSPSQRIKDLF